MSGQTTATVATVGAIAAAATGGELAQVFNELLVVMAIMGAFGGLTHGLAMQLPWREIVRGVTLGVLLAGGIGVLGPYVASAIMGVEIVASEGGVRALAATSFLIGFAQNFIIDWKRRGRQ